MSEKDFLEKICSPSPDKNQASFIVFAGENSQRLEYVCRFIFNHSLKVNFTICTDEEVFKSSPLFRINYSERLPDGAFRIKPAGLLSEKKIPENKPEAFVKNEMLYFFENGIEPDFHFDIFSAVFYMISRIEEWQSFQKDQHERFELKESILHKHKFHLKPVVDIWIEELKEELLKKFSMLSFPPREFKTIASIDVDNLYAYKGKGFIRTVGAGLKDLIRLDFANIMRRNRVINNIDEDPFDIYSSFSLFCSQNNIPLVFFFLFRSGTKYDRTVHPASPAFAKAIDAVKKNGAVVGLHPSYETAENAEQLKTEVSSFSKHGAVNFSRQHFLRFNIQSTPHELLKNGIKADFSMGFASGAGFRAGTTQPFYFYDFNKEEITDLLFVPFCAMDGAYFIYSKVSAETALNELLSIKNEVRRVNGIFLSVFHERTFAEHLYPGFGEMYKKLLLA
jgi:hypothetical protein